MRKKLMMVLYAGALAVICLCACGEGSADMETNVVEGVEKQKEEKQGPNFSGTVENIDYEFYYNEEFVDNTMGIILTNQDEEHHELDVEIDFYGEDGEILQTREFYVPYVESKVPYVCGMGLDFKDKIANVDVRLTKRLRGFETMGIQYLDLKSGWLGNGVKVEVKNISEDMLVDRADVSMFFYNKGKFVAYRGVDIKGNTDRKNQFHAQESYSFETTVDMEVDDVVCYLSSVGAWSTKDE